MSATASEYKTFSRDSPEPTICRDYLRNVCKRGRRCKFWHPPQIECDKIRRSERIFCHDFQNSVCRRPACKFLHYSREDEEIFRLTGRLPNELEQSQDGPSIFPDDMPPICKDFLNGICSRGPICKYRHISLEKRSVNRTFIESNSQLHLCPNLSFSAASSHNSSVLSSGVIPIQPPITTSMMAVSFSTADSSQPLSFSSAVSPTNDSVLTPIKGVYMNNNTPSLVKVVDHLGSSSSSIQHTLYAHPHNLGGYTSLVSSTNQAAPCSSVLAVVAEPSHHPAAVLQHPSAVATSQTTYHLLSNGPAPIQPHLLSSSSSASSAPTLLTIPLPQFACDNKSSTALLTSQVSVACTSQQPAVLTNVLPTSATIEGPPGACFSSYNVLQITPSSAVETHTLPAFASQHPRAGEVPSSSSTSAVLAAAAAAGYLARHLPVVAGTPENLSVSVSSSHITSIVSDGSQQRISKLEVSGEENQESSALAAAANFPAASAAAAAAVAAAKAFVARTAPVTLDTIGCSLETSQRSFTGNDESHNDQGSEQPSTIVAKSATEPSSNSASTATCASCSTTTMTTSNASIVSSKSTSSTSSTSQISSTGRFLHSNDAVEEEHAKTAAAVAAAACIGAMFSQPLSTANSTSSVAAMIGDIMGKNHLNLSKASAIKDMALSSKTNHRSRDSNNSSVRPVESSFNNLDETHKTMDASNVSMPSKTMVSNCREQFFNDVVATSQATRQPSNLCTSGADETRYHPHVNFSNAPTWSSVATTVASAAQAAAAAAVVASEAVCRSAKFFNLNRSKAHQSDVLDSDFVRQSIKEQSLSNEFSSACDPQQSSPTDRGRPSLSPNTAATMTAAVMAAAAATAAAKQRCIFPGTRHPSYSECVDSPFAKQSRVNLQPEDLFNTDDSEYAITSEGSDRYSHLKRRLKIRSGSSVYGYVHSKEVPLDVDEDEEEPDAFDDDVDTAMSIAFARENVSPYERALQGKPRTTGHYGTIFAHQTDDSHPASGDTSPSDSFDVVRFHNAEFSDPTPNKNAEDVSENPLILTHSGWCSEVKSITSVPSVKCCISESIDRNTKLSSVYKDSTGSSMPPRGKRSRSVDCSTLDRSHKTIRRAHSTPCLKLNICTEETPFTNFNRFNSESSQTDFTFSSKMKFDTVHGDLQRFPTGTKRSFLQTAVGKLRTKSPRITVPLKHEVKSIQKVLPRVPRNRRSNSSRNMRSVKKMVLSQSAETRPQSTASPDSVMTEEFSGHDDDVDVDTEDYDDDLFELRSSESSKRSALFQNRRFKYPLRHLPVGCSASMRQHHALKAENARLRRKLSDLMKQRGDLRAANEILLEQNARLRHSSKRASAVARMAESATKIIEAHSKSQLTQSTMQPPPAPGFPSSITELTQPRNPFSFPHAVVHQSADGPLRGAYVSSPTASAPQASHAVALGGQHPLFPSAMLASAVPNAITISNAPRALATVQLQATADTLTPNSIAPQSSILPQAMDAQSSASGFYPHQLHSINPLSGSMTNLTHPNLTPVSSAIQVCHYPIRSSGTMFPTLRQATAVTPSIVPVGASNALTLLVGQAPTAYTRVGSTTALHLPNTAKTEQASVNITPVPQLSYVYQQSAGPLGTSTQCLSSNPLSVAEPMMPSAPKTTIAHGIRHSETRTNIV